MKSITVGSTAPLFSTGLKDKELGLSLYEIELKLFKTGNVYLKCHYVLSSGNPSVQGSRSAEPRAKLAKYSRQVARQ